MPDRDPLQQLHGDATLRIDQGSSFAGTGLSIVPGHVITCAHVVRGRGTDERVWVHVGDSRVVATVRAELPATITRVDGFELREPDLAWLEIDAAAPSYARLDPEPPRLSPRPDRLWTAGFTRVFSDQPELSFGTYDVQGERRSPDGRRCTWQLARGEVTYGMSGAGLLNLRSGLMFGLVTRSRGVATDLGGWGVSAYQVLDAPELQALRELHDRHHEQDHTWDEARARAVRLARASASPGGSIGWAVDHDEQAGAVRRAVVAFNEAFGEYALSQVRYLGTRGGRRLGAPGGRSEADLTVASSTAIVLITDDLAASAPCYELAAAAARANRTVTLVSRDPDSIAIQSSLGEISFEGDLVVQPVDLSNYDLQSAVGLAMVRERERIGRDDRSGS